MRESKYNERRAEYKHAFSELQGKLKINALGNLSKKEFKENKSLITNPEVQRNKHTAYENQRALQEDKANDLIKKKIIYSQYERRKYTQNNCSTFYC